MQALPYLMAAGTAVQGLGAMSEANYQSAVMKQNAEIADQNARRTMAQSAQDAADKDMEARLEIGAVLAQASVSGLDMNSGSMLLRRRDMSSFAGQDRRRIIEGGRAEAENSLQEAAGYRAQSRALRKGMKWQLLGTALSAGSSFLNGRDMVSKINYQRSR